MPVPVQAPDIELPENIQSNRNRRYLRDFLPARKPEVRNRTYPNHLLRTNLTQPRLYYTKTGARSLPLTNTPPHAAAFRCASPTGTEGGWPGSSGTTRFPGECRVGNVTGGTKNVLDYRAAADPGIQKCPLFRSGPAKCKG